MRKLRILTFLTFVLVLLLGAVAAEAGTQDEAPTYPISFTYDRARIIEPGKYWIDEKGVHIRGRVYLGAIGGDLEGTAYVTYNADLTGEIEPSLSPEAQILPDTGTSYGTMTIYSDSETEPLPGWSGWSGKWQRTIDDGLVEDGSMIAFSQQQNWVMTIQSVTEDENGSFFHEGEIQRYCAERGCDMESLAR